MWQGEGTASIIYTHLSENKLHWRRRQHFQPKHRNKLNLHGVITQKSVGRTTQVTRTWNLIQNTATAFTFVPSGVKYGEYPLQNLTLGFNTRTSKTRTSHTASVIRQRTSTSATPVTVEYVKYYCVMHGRKIWTLSNVLSGGQENSPTVTGHEATADCLLKQDDRNWSSSAERARWAYVTKDSAMRIPVVQPPISARASNNVKCMSFPPTLRRCVIYFTLMVASPITHRRWQETSELLIGKDLEESGSG